MVGFGAELVLDGLVAGERVVWHESTLGVPRLDLHAKLVEVDLTIDKSLKDFLALRRAELAFQAGVGCHLPQRLAALAHFGSVNPLSRLCDDVSRR
jgi:hypothetical protein